MGVNVFYWSVVFNTIYFANSYIIIKLLSLTLTVMNTLYLYHLTTKINLISISKDGIIPFVSKSRFGSMSCEARDGKPKIFLLPTLNGVGMKGFIKEWWHGDKKDIVILRIKQNSINFFKSEDCYNARHEVWTYEKIPRERIEFHEGIISPYKWKLLG